MIYDYENCFLFNEDAAGTPRVVANGEGGNAYNELFLVAKFVNPLKTATVITLKTGDTETPADELCTLSVPKGAQNASVRVPFGGKKYYTVALSDTTGGKCTVALTLDTDLA